jgi:hypothetical protein
MVHTLLEKGISWELSLLHLDAYDSWRYHFYMAGARTEAVVFLSKIWDQMRAKRSRASCRRILH